MNSLCLHLNSLCLHLNSLCLHLSSLCLHLSSLCLRLYLHLSSYQLTGNPLSQSKKLVNQKTTHVLNCHPVKILRSTVPFKMPIETTCTHATNITCSFRMRRRASTVLKKRISCAPFNQRQGSRFSSTISDFMKEPS